MTNWIALMSSFIFIFAQPDQYNRSEVDELSVPACYYRILEIEDPLILQKISGYIKKVESDALPIVSILTKGDSSYVYITATIAANSLKNSPPSYMTIFEDRDIAIYNGKKALEGECLEKAVAHYRNVLQIDQSNRLNGYPPGEKVYYTYDAVSAKITLINNKIVSIDNSFKATRDMPYYKTSF